MSDKDKIITYIDKLLEKYPKNYYLLMVAEFIDSLQEEPVSGDLEGAAKEHFWKPSDGDDLPEIDREVIVLTQPYPLGGNEYIASFAHRPNPNGWDGKSLSTGKVEHYTPKTYDKGGWNIPNIVYWLDVELPKEIEP